MHMHMPQAVGTLHCCAHVACILDNCLARLMSEDHSCKENNRIVAWITPLMQSWLQSLCKA